MAEAMTEGLSGTEIIDDVLAQIKRKLLTSCNLRDSDNYGQGYSAEIKISMKMYAMDATPDEFTVNIAPKALPPVSTEEVIVTPFDVAEDLTIPQELDLEAVRERIKEPAPLPLVDETEESRMPQRLKRKYTRRTGVPSLEQAASGGAVDLDEKF